MEGLRAVCEDAIISIIQRPNPTVVFDVDATVRSRGAVVLAATALACDGSFTYSYHVTSFPYLFLPD